MGKQFFLFSEELKKILIATRVKRASYAPLSIFSAASFINILNIDIIFLAIISLFVYSIGGLYNAKRDNDYKIKEKHFYITVFILVFISLGLSLVNLKILLLMLFAIFLVICYNTIGRKILYGDIFIAGLTHIFIPFMGTLWILNADLLQYIPYALIPTLSFILIVNVKNIIGFKKDKKRGYVTLMTKFYNGKTLMKISSLIGLFIIISFPLIFNLKLNIFLIIFILGIFIFLIRDIGFLEGKRATSLARLIIVIILFGYLIENQAILIINLLFLLSGALFIKEGLIALINGLKTLKIYK